MQHFILISLGVLVLTSIITAFLRSKAGNIIFIISTGILSLSGAVGALILRGVLTERLKKREYIDEDFIIWALGKYDTYAIIITLVTLFIIIAMSVLIIKNHCNTALTRIMPVISIDVTMVIFSFIYTIGTINKLFDVGSYIFDITLFNILMLNVVFLVKRIAAHYKRDKGD